MPTLTGRYLHGDGTPRVGALRFSPSVTIVGDDTIILPTAFHVPLVDGEFTVTDMVATDDPAYAPSGWVWTVEERLTGGRTWSFELTGDADLSDLTPVVVPGDYATFVMVGDELTASLTSGAATATWVPTADGAGGIDWAAPAGGGGAVDSVNGQTGVVVLDNTDVGAAATAHAHTLSDVSDAGGAAALEVGTTTGTVAAGDDARLTDDRNPTAHASTHAAAGDDPVTLAQSQVTNLSADLAARLRMPYQTGVTAGEDNLRRELITNVSGLGTGILYLSYFTAQKSEAVASLSMVSGTGAAATPTLCKMAFFQVADANNDAASGLTLLGVTANDATLFASANTLYTRALTTPTTKVAGTRYAVGMLVVTGATMPTMAGLLMGAQAAPAHVAPLVAAVLTGQTDITGDITATVGPSTRILYAAVLPT